MRPIAIRMVSVMVKVPYQFQTVKRWMPVAKLPPLWNLSNDNFALYLLHNKYFQELLPRTRHRRFLYSSTFIYLPLLIHRITLK